jgi:hypothetical protein
VYFDQLTWDTGKSLACQPAYHALAIMGGSSSEYKSSSAESATTKAAALKASRDNESWRSDKGSINMMKTKGKEERGLTCRMFKL